MGRGFMHCIVRVPNIWVMHESYVGICIISIGCINSSKIVNEIS